MLDHFGGSLIVRKPHLLCGRDGIRNMWTSMEEQDSWKVIQVFSLYTTAILQNSFTPRYYSALEVKD